MLSYLREKLARILPYAALMLVLGGACVVIALAAEEPLMYVLAAADMLIGLFLLALTGRNALRDILLWRRLGCVEEALEDRRTAVREEDGKIRPILQLNITALPSEGWVDAVVSRIMGAVAERNPQVILRRPNL